MKDISFGGIDFFAGERIKVEQSLKYSSEESRLLWNSAGLAEVARWGTSDELYSKCPHALGPEYDLAHADASPECKITAGYVRILMIS